MVFFFFKQKTAYEMRISDWSSDVCSSDLDWNIDKEGIVPAQIFGQPATDQRPHDRTQNHCHAEQRHADRLLMGRQSFRHDGHRSWYQRTTHETLTRSTADHGRAVGRHTAKHCTTGDRDKRKGTKDH